MVRMRGVVLIGFPSRVLSVGFRVTHVCEQQANATLRNAKGVSQQML